MPALWESWSLSTSSPIRIGMSSGLPQSESGPCRCLRLCILRSIHRIQEPRPGRPNPACSPRVTTGSLMCSMPCSQPGFPSSVSIRNWCRPSKSSTRSTWGSRPYGTHSSSSLGYWRRGRPISSACCGNLTKSTTLTGSWLTIGGRCATRWRFRGRQLQGNWTGSRCTSIAQSRCTLQSDGRIGEDYGSAVRAPTTQPNPPPLPSPARNSLARLRSVEHELHLANPHCHPLFEQILDDRPAVYIGAVFALQVKKHVARFELFYPRMLT